MKKVISILFLFVLMSPLSSAAADTAYELPELNMTIETPADWIVFTRDIDTDDPNLVDLGFDAETMKQGFIDNSIYLNAFPTDYLSEIVVTMVSNTDTQEAYDYNNGLEDAFPELKEGFETAFSDMGATITDMTTYQHDQASFVVIDFEQQDSGLTIYSREYNTIINGQTINITLHSYNGSLTSAHIQILKTIVDSVTFTKVTSKPGFDYMEIVYAGIGGAVIAVVVTLILKSAKKKKTAENFPSSDDGPSSP